MSVRDRIATPEGKRRYVRDLFATIASRYDLITVVLSYGRDRHWKARLVDLAAPAPGIRALDLATGTGDIAFAVRARGARVVGLDITPRMLELARRKDPDARTDSAGGRGALPFLAGDMTALPFVNAVFDLVTTGYGLRNVPDLTGAIDEVLRVLKPGGRAFSLDFNRPSNRLIRAAYLMYLALVGGALGWLLHRDPDTYRYIPASIRGHPDGRALAQLMEERGFVEVRYHRVLGGLMAIHQARKFGLGVPRSAPRSG